MRPDFYFEDLTDCDHMVNRQRKHGWAIWWRGGKEDDESVKRFITRLKKSKPQVSSASVNGKFRKEKLFS
jgi:hypothetical protein